MAIAAPTPCVEPGCPLFKVAGYSGRCLKHGAAKAKVDKAKRKRGPNRRSQMNEEDHKLDSFYSSRDWIRTSRSYRKRHPLCVRCQADGRVVAANVVDHIVERRDGGANFDHSNMQSLCHRHHNQKTLGERARRLNPWNVSKKLGGDFT